MSEAVANIIYLGYHITSALIEAKVLRLRTLVPQKYPLAPAVYFTFTVLGKKEGSLRLTTV